VSSSTKGSKACIILTVEKVTKREIIIIILKDGRDGLSHERLLRFKDTFAVREEANHRPKRSTKTS
jgi:hypothetical protein